ncbi:putative ribonuclease [Mizuhopecten yessoensis]|uniref:Ribonuclease n=1 Tax=Mizuhopecten yessoensis TaxID=6573 RepID=A0A210QZV2_MIZYE|nr:putative ribonuclease [Mizuhopecten yessoensis]OWF54293.1 ribonuclease [Mizuhopecten yessoensis]
MSVVIHNMQRLIKLDLRRLERDVRYLRRLMGLTSFHMGIQCVEDDEISEANIVYRGVEGATDVLAFPFLEDLEPGKPLPEIADPDRRLLGDLMLGIPYIHKNAQLNREQLEGTLSVMVLHGMCHLIGYDHETKDQWQQMYNKELTILDKFNQKTGYTCKPLLGIGHG